MKIFKKANFLSSLHSIQHSPHAWGDILEIENLLKNDEIRAKTEYRSEVY